MSFDTDLRTFAAICAPLFEGEELVEYRSYETAADALRFSPQKRAALVCAYLNEWKVGAGVLTYAQWKRGAKKYGYCMVKE